MDIQELVKQPRESLTIELKSWIDPDTPGGIKTLIKTAIAMRNNNGGYILIGFDNNTCQPDHDHVPENVQELFHQDKIQGMVAKYASEAFEVEIHFPEIEGNAFPVIEIRPGVRTPVGTKRDYIENGATYIPQNKVYVRSLSSNNTPSTTEATWKDWGPLVETCFDNREADIGRFLRRHIGGLSPEVLGSFAASITEGMKPEETLEETVKNFLQKGQDRFQVRAAEKKVLPEEFGTSEVAAVIDGEVPPHSANLDFLRLIDSSNPNHSGWPSWVVLHTPRDKEAKPYMFEGAWESFIISSSFEYKTLDFWRVEPEGCFYLLEALEDDFSGSDRTPKPFEAFDFGTPIYRVAESLAVSLAFARAMGCESEKTQLAYCFKWTRLKGRVLCSWKNPARYISPGRTAFTDEAVSEIIVPLDTPDSALAQYVQSG